MKTMLIKNYGLRCDRCGTPGGSGFSTSQDVRAYARRNGWTRVPKRGDQQAEDRCSRCTRRVSL